MRPGWRHRLRSEKPALLLPLAVALAFAGLVTGREILWGDFVSWYFPSHHYAAERLSQGELPLWNPYNDCGMPFMGEADHGTLYPPSLLLHLVGPHKVVLFHALQAFTLLHILWGALTCYALARSLGCTPWASAAGGLAFGLSGTFVARAAHVSLVCAQAWLPAALGGLHHAVRGASRRGLAVSAGAMGLIALSGSPATAVVTAVGLVVVGFATAMAEGPGTRVWALARAAVMTAAAVALGLLLGMIQLLPMMELVRHSERSAYGYAEVANYSVTPDSLMMLVLPRFYGWLRYGTLSYWGPENFAELSGYVGLLTLCLVPAALTLRPLRQTGPWLALAAFGLWLGLGPHAGLHRLFYDYVPVLGSMRAPARFLLLWACGLAVLAALGLDRVAAGLRDGSPQVRRYAAAAIVVLLVVAVAVLLWWPAGRRGFAEWQQPYHLSSCRRALAAIAVSVAAIAAALRLRSEGRIGAVWCAALTLDLALQWQGVGLHPAAEIAQVIGPTEPYLHPSRSDPALHRVDSRFTNPGEMLMARVPADSGPGRHLLDYETYRGLFASRGSPLFDLLNIKYVVEQVSPAVTAPGPNLVAPEGLTLDAGAAGELVVDPSERRDGVEIVLTASAGDLPSGALLGEVELLGSAPPLVHPIRLGGETGEMSGGHPPSAAAQVPVKHYVHVADAAALLRAYYRYELRVDPRDISAVRLRHAAGTSALLVKEVRLLGQPGAADTWRLVTTVNADGPLPIRVHENVDAAPRVWVARRFVLLPSRADALRRLREGTIDLRRDVVIEPPPGRDASTYTLPARNDAPTGDATVTHYAPEAITVSAGAGESGAWLVFSEVSYPGWIATIDGKAADLARANGLFRAVWLEPGRHEVVLRYRPRSFYTGAAISGLTALALLVAGLSVRPRAGARGSDGRSEEAPSPAN